MAADRDLLFGLLALQNGLIDQVQLVAAFQAWTRDRARPLADHLLDRGDLDADQRSVVAAMATLHLKKHGGDAGESLAALPAGRSTRDRLKALDDADLNETLSRAGPGSTEPDADADATVTASYAVGSTTADGQRFRVLRPHARGGLGAVFVALDGELNREVALKQILDQHADDPGSRRRFLVEAEITGGLEHPGIVPVYGLGAYRDGRPYYAMRFIRGDSLKQAIIRFHDDPASKADPGRRSLELRHLLRRFTDVCNAIEYAHSRGVLHRDIKPGNVIVGTHGETLVVDWGLARAQGRSAGAGLAEERTLRPPSAGDSSETVPGTALGTPAYMSPEQARGDLEALGPRSDVYSLGATLYHLMTGKAAFEGDAGSVLRRVRLGAFPAPRALDPSIDPALEAVCLKAMATRPEDRYASCRELAEDVDRWAADEPVACYREPFARRARRRAKRHRTAVIAAAVALVAGLAGLGAVAAVQARANGALASKNVELTRANDLVTEANAELERANARVEARFELAREAIRAFQDGVNEDDMLKGAELKGLRDKLLRSAAGFYEKLEALLRGQTDRDSRGILGRSYFELGELTEAIGIQTEALAVHRKALAIRRGLASDAEADAEATLDLARSLNATGRLAHATGDSAGALSAFAEARALLGTPADGPSASDEALEVLGATRHGTADVLSATGELAEASAEYREALAIRRRLVEADPAATDGQDRLAGSLLGFGHLRGSVGESAEAMESYREAMAIWGTLADDHPADTGFRSRLAIGHTQIGFHLARRGQEGDALASFREASAILRSLADENPAVTDFRDRLADALNSIGTMLERAGETDEAQGPYLEMLGLRRTLVDENPAVVKFRNSLAVNHLNLGWLAARTGQPGRAKESYREALAILRPLAEEHPDLTDSRELLAATLINVGMLGAQLGTPAEALASYEEAREILLELVGRSPRRTEFRDRLSWVCYSIGELLDRAGRPAEALEAIRESADLRRRLIEDNPDFVDLRRLQAYTLDHLGSLQAKLGRPAGELEAYREAAAVCRRLAEDHPGDDSYRRDLSYAHNVLGRTLTRDGDLAGAIEEHRRAVAVLEQVTPTPETLYQLACGRSLLAGVAARPGSGIPGPEGEALARSAVSDLRRATRSGDRGLDDLRGDAALDPLRGRDDFRALLADLAFPAEPFAR
ncbi:serine/threonine-protein kinase [Tautonia plasticadhaerens]|uniref:Serine/threonine-protein kinase PknD n=1 Tax=Tautonia plasticadhaerens TaxID=2527974 RepID=A0A518H1Y2_9BACT|nr:serine/threonine-protein kinase [Tautonia plasticadhaerens]QDV34835.1 Serine/threonine-protein kinase PknD [Tautonia plasticadhaerens]